jgi:predicted acylesterase/phospholipase RssA
MGRIAAVGSPQALSLFRDVMAASASIPVVFPPMMIDAEANGKHFQEMHVDGGVLICMPILWWTDIERCLLLESMEIKWQPK